MTHNISAPAKQMIVKMLQADPASRPKIQSLSCTEFMVNGYTPPSLPTSALTMAPRFDQFEKNTRTPLIEVTNCKSSSKYYKLINC